MRLFNKVTIVGTGLIGGSIGLALRKKRLAGIVVGVTQHRRSLALAIKNGAIDKGTLDGKAAVKGADLVVLAAPVRSIEKLAKEIMPYLKPGALLIDVGSTKGEVVKMIEGVLRKDVFFVGTHPLAGSEHSGVGYAKPDLFDNSSVFIIKDVRTNSAALKKVVALYKRLGAKRVVISTARHDAIVAEVSHLPHIVATALVEAVSPGNLKFAATGFKDTTRIAAGEPKMWRDICLTNKKEIARSIGRFILYLNKLRNAISREDGQALLREFAKARKIRESLNER